MKYLIATFLLMVFLSSAYTSSTRGSWKEEETKAKQLFNEGKIDEAIIIFREIILQSSNEDVKREAYFWVAMAYLAQDKYKLVELNLEYYLKNYQSSGLNYAEAMYQKGRLLFLQQQYQAGIEQFNVYIEQYPGHNKISNGYYWIGECLFALGHFDDSALFFKIVIQKYPNSYKREACNYKLRLIEHKKSELALQNLLKWSQEQFLATLNKLKVKEQTLEEALTYKTDEAPETPDFDSYDQKLKQIMLKEAMLKKKEEALRLIEEKLRERETELNEMAE